MGCGVSSAAKVVPSPEISRPPQRQAEPAGISQGATVSYNGEEYIVQYHSSKGMLDLKHKTNGEVVYGVAPEEVTPLREAAVAQPEQPALATGCATSAPAPSPAEEEEETDDETSQQQLTLLNAEGTDDTSPKPLAPAGGSGALVYRCRLDGVDEPLAVKILKRSTARADHLTTLRAEVAMCRPLAHSSIVRFVHSSTAMRIDGERHVAIVMQLLPTSIDALIAARAECVPPRPFSVSRLAAVARQLADALAYLHDGLSPPLLHRDIKPANIFLSAAALAADAHDDAADDEVVGGVRLGDFDVAVRAEQSLIDFVGTPTISTPPEMWLQQPHHTPADVWAYGMTLQCCMLLGDPLVDATMTDIEQRLTATPNPKIPLFDAAADGARAATDALYGELAELARKCCCHEPKERLAAAELHAHVPPAEQLSALLGDVTA